MRAVLRCALMLVVLAAGCSSGDDEPEVAGLQIERETSSTTSSASTSTSATTPTTPTTTTATTVAPAATTTTTVRPRPATTTTTAARPPAPATTTTTTPPPDVGPPQPGRVEGTVVLPEGTRARLFLVDTNDETVRGSDELASSGEFSFGDVAPGDYRVDTSTVAADGATSEARGADFTVGQANVVRLRCDPRCAPA